MYAQSGLIPNKKEKQDTKSQTAKVFNKKQKEKHEAHLLRAITKIQKKELPLKRKHYSLRKT